MTDADCIVIGAGLIGLQTALELRKRLPQARIVVLERGVLPAGASTRNAGFACFGSFTEILDDLDRIGHDATLDLIERRWRGLGLLRSRMGDAAMDYEALGGYELIRKEEESSVERLDEVNDLLRPLLKTTVFSIDAQTKNRACFAPAVMAVIRNPLEGQIHSGKLMRSLAAIAMENRIEILTGAEVDSLQAESAGVLVSITNGPVMRAQQVAICTNALIPGLATDMAITESGVAPTLPAGLPGIVPGRGQVIVTEPIADLPWRGCYHLERGFYYFRNIGTRVLLGGARNLDFEGEATADMAITPRIQHALESVLSELILPGRSFQISHRWSGIMGFSNSKQALVYRIGERVTAGFGCNGMGVALSAQIAEETAQLMTSSGEP